MMTRRKSKMEENIEEYRSTHPTYKQFCQKQNVWPVCSEFSVYNSIIFLEYLREILHVSNSAVVSSPLSRQSKYIF